MMRVFLVLVLVFFGYAAAADDVATAFNEGRWGEVIKAAETDTSFSTQLYAARAYMVKGSFLVRGDAAYEALLGAERHLANAMAINSDTVRVRATAVLVSGFHAKYQSKPKLAKEVLRMIEENIERFPNSHLSHGALAGWHSETSSKGFLARSVLGAKRSIARDAYDKALAINNRDIPLLYEYSKFLARGKKEERKQALGVFERIANLKPHDAAEAIFQQKAANIHTALKLDNKKTLKRSLEENSPFPDFGN